VSQESLGTPLAGLAQQGCRVTWHSAPRERHVASI
jgi:hypothetical protein